MRPRLRFGHRRRQPTTAARYPQSHGRHASNASTVTAAMMTGTDTDANRRDRSWDARLVGKANLHELAMLPTGTNPWFGTPDHVPLCETADRPLILAAMPVNRGLPTNDHAVALRPRSLACSHASVLARCRRRVLDVVFLSS